VASVSGDARRALQICRRAAEIAERDLKATPFEEQQNVRVELKHIDETINEMTRSPYVLTIQNASFHEKLWICALLIELRHSGIKRKET